MTGVQTCALPISTIMDKKSTIYVRTDAREFTLNSTLNILINHFPNHKVKIISKPFQNRTQTEICGNKTKNSGEMDIILTRGN